MTELECPWCEAAVVIRAHEAEAGGTCPECLTSWRYETSDEEELALAA